MTVTQLINRVRTRLGTNVASRFTNDVILNNLNIIRENMIIKYHIEEFIKDSTLTFVSGIADLPSDYYRTLKEQFVINDKGEKIYKSLWIDNTYYKQVSFQQFNSEDGEEDNYIFTIKNISGVKKVYIYPENSTTLNFRYIYKPADMTIDNDDDSQLPSQIENLFALETAREILINFREYEGHLDRLITEEKTAYTKQSKDYGERNMSSFKASMLGENIYI